MATSDHHAKDTILLLDKFSANDIEKWKAKQEGLFDFYWDEYSYYANERSKLASKIQKALIKGAIPYSFDGWYRVLTQKYNNNPLSAAGSRINEIGGRFNFGQIDASKFPPFSCFYIAESHETAVTEKFSTQTTDANGIKREELSGGLVSHTVSRVQGNLELVLDVTDKKALAPFVNAIKRISVPEALKKKAKKMKISEPTNIQTPAQLRNILKEHDWAAQPSLLNIPAPSQIFGHIVYNAGIQGILYQSKHTKELCLGIFPENFEGNGSYVKLQDAAPKGVLTEMNSDTWRQTY